MQTSTTLYPLFYAALLSILVGCSKPLPTEATVQEMRVANSLELAASPGILGGVMPVSSAIYAGFSLTKISPKDQGEISWLAVDGEQSMLLHQSEVPLREGNVVVALRAAKILPPGMYRVVLSINGIPKKSRDFQLTPPPTDAASDPP